MRTREKIKMLHELAEDLQQMQKEQEQRPRRIKQINDKIIEKWYDQFIPEYYDRTESLFDVLQIKATSDGGVDLTFDTDAIDNVYHHQNSDIIYHNVYELGYHGGSLGKPDIVGYSPAEPSWRIGCGDMWHTDPAPRSKFSPHQKIKDEITKYNTEYNNKIKNIEERLSLINQMYGGK